MMNACTGAGERKCALTPLRAFLLAILAGAFIALAGVAATFGNIYVNKAMGAAIFPAGLAMVLLAGSELFTGNCLITMSVLDKNGAHIGGCIIPGVKISMDALTDRTALLPGLQLDQPKKAIGRNTIDAMRSGIMLGTACMLDGMVERFEEELGAKTTVVITGGIAKFIAPLCKTPMIYDKDLIIKGLAILYRDNKRK